ERKNRKSRIRLSCTECRKRKLSCDRNFPCQRCVRTGRANKCRFESLAEQPSVANTGVAIQSRKSDEIKKLRAEVADLRALLERSSQNNGSGGVEASRSGDGSPRRRREVVPLVGCNVPREVTGPNIEVLAADVTENSSAPDPKFRSTAGYYVRHSIFRFFGEIRGIFPLVREIENEWFKPLGVRLSRDKSASASHWHVGTVAEILRLESLLPPKKDTDVLVSFYLDYQEQVYRIVHVPTFKREYDNYWLPGRPRHPAMTALIIGMISLSTCAPNRFSEVVAVNAKYVNMPAQWVEACDQWLRRQSIKHRTLVYYQVGCILFFSKRANSIRKKSYWKEGNSLLQDAIMDSLNWNSSSVGDTPYILEIKRRLWAVIKEINLQNAFEYGLPTLLHSVGTDVPPPSNIDDGDFDETTAELPAPQPLSQYTSASYLVHSAESWETRLEISLRLFCGRGTQQIMPYEDVVRQTHMVMRAIDALPPWGSDEHTEMDGSKTQPIITYTYLQVQLQECILALHRPFLAKQGGGRYWMSETACDQAARNILLVNYKLADMGIQSLSVLRNNICMSMLFLVRLTLLQPKGSSGLILSNSKSTIELLEKCYPMMEDDYFRNGGPWCFLTVCAAVAILKAHIGLETRQSGKEVCARRFLDMYYRTVGRNQ
ncbi:hypothetical protein BX600DRAFT_367309, partial [Xylariales sp. PMI_506]